MESCSVASPEIVSCDLSMLESDNRMKNVSTIATWSDFKIRMRIEKWSIAFLESPVVLRIPHLTFSFNLFVKFYSYSQGEGEQKKREKLFFVI